MASSLSPEERIIELATFLDPEAFSYERDGPLAHRREAALEEARNRVRRAEARAADASLAPAEG